MGESIQLMLSRLHQENYPRLEARSNSCIDISLDSLARVLRTMIRMDNCPWPLLHKHRWNILWENNSAKTLLEVKNIWLIIPTRSSIFFVSFKGVQNINLSFKRLRPSGVDTRFLHWAKLIFISIRRILPTRSLLQKCPRISNILSTVDIRLLEHCCCCFHEIIAIAECEGCRWHNGTIDDMRILHSHPCRKHTSIWTTKRNHGPSIWIQFVQQQISKIGQRLLRRQIARIRGRFEWFVTKWQWLTVIAMLSKNYNKNSITKVFYFNFRSSDFIPIDAPNSGAISHMKPVFCAKWSMLPSLPV